MKKLAFLTFTLATIGLTAFGHLANQQPTQQVRAQEQPKTNGEVRFPTIEVEPIPLPKPTPAAVTTLGVDVLYVIDSDLAVLLFDSPKGMVKVAKEVGPLRVRGKFVGGVGVETKNFKGKQIYLIESAKTGPVELIVVPVGAVDEKDALRRILDVDAGEGPRPPPKPDPVPPSPTPIVDKLAIVVVWESADSTPEIASVMKDIKFWRSLETKGNEWWQYDKDQPIVAAKGYSQFVAQHGLPTIIYLSPTGKVLQSGRLPTKTADIADSVKKLTGK